MSAKIGAWERRWRFSARFAEFCILVLRILRARSLDVQRRNAAPLISWNCLRNLLVYPFSKFDIFVAVICYWETQQLRILSSFIWNFRVLLISKGWAKLIQAKRLERFLSSIRRKICVFICSSFVFLCKVSRISSLSILSREFDELFANFYMKFCNC